ncbi:hypothetical protein HDC94_001815 [Leifsonia sp. AK011]|nr:hypothetical protein [Leifsonia sp. AK011]NYF10659.1 hypothetical protein [Leifsonia sp. AK011]
MSDSAAGAGTPKHRKGDEKAPENPFEDADLDISDFGENPDTETAG